MSLAQIKPTFNEQGLISSPDRFNAMSGATTVQEGIADAANADTYELNPYNKSPFQHALNMILGDRDFARTADFFNQNKNEELFDRVLNYLNKKGHTSAIDSIKMVMPEHFTPQKTTSNVIPINHFSR